MSVRDMSEDQLAVEKFREGALELRASVGDNYFWRSEGAQPCFAEGK
jgi:hypothetical protein